MWELQHLSDNRRTTEISLLLGKNTSLTLPHKYLTTQWDYSLFTLLFFSLTWCAYNVWMHCLFIGKNPCKSKWPSGQLSSQYICMCVHELIYSQIISTNITNNFSHIKVDKKDCIQLGICCKHVPYQKKKNYFLKIINKN